MVFTLSRSALHSLNQTIRHKNMQFIPEMGWIATFLCLFGIQQAKHLNLN
jgi:hypothetical protein